MSNQGTPPHVIAERNCAETMRKGLVKLLVVRQLNAEYQAAASKVKGGIGTFLVTFERDSKLTTLLEEAIDIFKVAAATGTEDDVARSEKLREDRATAAKKVEEIRAVINLIWSGKPAQSEESTKEKTASSTPR